jgi:DNA-binding transcriptional ArsR family regulator
VIRKDYLELENRKNIYNYILKHPGLNLIELSRKLKIPKSTLDYHLVYLKKRGIIASSSEGIYTRFYVSDTISCREKKLLALFRQKIPRKIVLLLLLYPEYFSQINLSKYLKIRPAAVYYHMNKLIEMDIIESVRIKNHREIFSNSNNIDDIYEKRFRLLFDTPFKHNKKAKRILNKNRKKILANLNGVKGGFSENRFPDGKEISYKIKNYPELYDFLINHKDSLMDDELSCVLDWVDDWHGKGSEIIFSYLNEIFPGLGTTYFP